MGRLFAFIIIAGFSLPLPSQTALGETYVTTYVTRVQEERRSTRFTLTEWLRIKERMKMMDVYLAMFSSPEKETFAPEFNIVGGMTQGTLSVDNGTTLAQEGSLNSQFGRFQLWLTNLISSTTKMRTLNVDFGVEGYIRQSSAFEPTATDTALAATSVTNASTFERNHFLRHIGGNFRIFGKNIQDSSLVLKIGNYDLGDSTARLLDSDRDVVHKGLFGGAELQLYLFRWLGVEGNYMKWGDESSFAAEQVDGNYYDYMAYIEISLFRVMGGMYAESFEYKFDDLRYKTQQAGPIGAIKAQF